MTYLGTTMTKSKELAQLTFQAFTTNDKPLAEIAVTRPQFEKSLANLEETVLSSAGRVVQKLAANVPERKVMREQERLKAQTFRAALSTLPRDQVWIDKRLK